MDKLQLRPDSDGYNQSDGTDAIQIMLDGGAPRTRRDKIGSWKTIAVKWTLSPLQYRYWRSFYALATRNASKTFLCDLVSEDGAGPVEHVCQFVPGSVSLPTQIGLTYVQQAQIVAKPIAHTDAEDQIVLDLYEAYGDAAPDILLAIERIANVDMPDAL